MHRAGLWGGGSPFSYWSRYIDHWSGCGINEAFWLQVTNDEAGLRGCWFPAAVRQVERGLVLVAYDEVDDEDTGDALQEWFPAPGAPGYLPALASNFKAHTAPGYLIRPQPPDNVSSLCSALHFVRSRGSCLLHGVEDIVMF